MEAWAQPHVRRLTTQRWAIVITEARVERGQEHARAQAEQASRLSPFARRFPRLFILLGILGPGLIAANAGNDAGGIATYAATGARYGYTLLWVVPIILVALVVVQEMCAKLGAVTGMGFSDLVREHFGVRWTSFVVAALLVANLGTAFSEFVGIGAAASLLHVPRLLAIPVAAVLLWVLIVAGSYKVVERAFLLMSLVFLAYPAAAVLAQPHWASVADGFVPSAPRSTPVLVLIVALIGTTITPYMQLYLQSSVAEKDVRPDEFVYERIDVISGSAFAIVVAIAIMVSTAAALHARGVHVNDAAEAARALEPVAGSGAETLFAIGLLGACLLAAPVLALTSAYTVTEAMGLPKGVSHDFRDAPVFMGLFTGIIALSAALAMIPGIPFTSTLVVIQIIDGIVLPVVVVCLLKLTNDHELMGRHRNGLIFNTVGVVTVVVVSALSVLLVGITVVQPLL